MSEILKQTSPDLTSAAIDAVFQEYHRHVHAFPENKIEPRSDVAKILQNFAGEYSNDVMYGIAQLIDIADKQSDSTQAWHAVEVGVFYALLLDAKPPNEHRPEYAIGLFRDIRTTNDQMSRQIATAIDGTNDESIKASIKHSLDPTSKEEIPTEVWSLDNTAYPDLESLAEFAKKINIEIILIKASQALQCLRDEHVFGARRLRTILEVETTLAPMCEILGLDALAATLNSEAICSRLEMSGEGWAIQAAKEQLGTLGDRKAAEAEILKLPNAILGETLSEAIIDESHQYETFFAHAFCEISGLKDSEDKPLHTTVVSRIKTIGSLAANILHNSKHNAPVYTAADTIGYTAIVDSDRESGAVFSKIVQSFRDMDNCELSSARSRNSPIHIKGSREYILTVIEGIDDSIVGSTMKEDISALFGEFTEIRTKEHAEELQARLKAITNGSPDIVLSQNGFNVIKVTANIIENDVTMPVEFQVVDKDARVNGRRGIASHIIHKLEKYGRSERNKTYLANKAKIADDIAAIYERKSRMTAKTSSYIPNGQSFEEAKNMLQWYRRREALRNGCSIAKSVLGFCGI